MKLTYLEERLQYRKDQGTFRTLSLPQPSIDLTSHDYFGFARSPDLLNRVHSNSDRIGATGSRLLTGHHHCYENLEKNIAHFHRAQSCLIYNTGYTANLGLLAAIGSKETTFLYDLEIHASMIDGIRLSSAKGVRCPPKTGHWNKKLNRV